MRRRPAADPVRTMEKIIGVGLVLLALGFGYWDPPDLVETWDDGTGYIQVRKYWGLSSTTYQLKYDPEDATWYRLEPDGTRSWMWITDGGELDDGYPDELGYPY